MAATLLLLLTGYAFSQHFWSRYYEAALVLQDFAAADGTSRLKQITPAPLRQPVSYAVAGRTHRADLYLPGSLEGCTLSEPLVDSQAVVTPNKHYPRAAIIAVPGAVQQNKDDTRFVAFAAAAPDNQTRVTLIHRVLGHVDLSISHLLSWRFWSEDLPDLWRLWRVIDLLLAQREEAA